MADITMPQLGETVTEGTITRWAKHVGDRVELDDGTSESTLSVDTSNSTSSSSTRSPTCLAHRVIVPSVTVSPSCGIVMSAIRRGASPFVPSAVGPGQSYR